jgi:hypothetical protein
MRAIILAALISTSFAAEVSQAEQNRLWAEAMKQSAAVDSRPKPTGNPDAASAPSEAGPIAREFPNVVIADADRGAMPMPADERARIEADKVIAFNKALEEKYGVKFKTSLALIGIGERSVVPESMRGMYFQLFSSDGTVNLDKIQTPHHFEFTSETMRARRMSSDKYLQTIGEPQPIMVFKCNDGVAISDGDRVQYVIRETSVVGVYMITRYFGESAGFSRFYELRK